MEKRNPRKIAVIGAGSWGTALAKLLDVAGHRVFLWARAPEVAREIRTSRENRAYLPGVLLSERVDIDSDLAMVADCEAVLMVVPSHGFRSVFTQVFPFLGPQTRILSATKGIENETLLTMTQVMQGILPKERKHAIAVLSGPSFAKEVAEGLPTAVTVASRTPGVAKYFQEILSSERFRAYTGADMIGLELGGAVKNIVAIAAGISDGLGFGTNTRAALVTRGLAEIIRLGLKMDANPLTFSGLGGLGDLILTATGDLSRNRQVGLQLGRGEKLPAIVAAMKMVAEGIKTTSSVYFLAQRHHVDMPITEQVHQVLYHEKPPIEAVRELMARDLKGELENW